MTRECPTFKLQQLPILIGSLGGNQRETDRLKAQKKAAANKAKPKESATTLAKRKERLVIRGCSSYSRSPTRLVIVMRKLLEQNRRQARMLDYKDSCLISAFRKRKRKKQPPQPQLVGVVNSIHISIIGADLADIDSFGVVLACSGAPFVEQCQLVPRLKPCKLQLSIAFTLFIRVRHRSKCREGTD